VPSEPPPPRRLRADAQRNRDALLAAARAAFVGGETEIRVEEIARRAGVAVGTLYRHFDTRDAVIEEVYRQEVAQLCASGQTLLEEHPPAEAVRLFLLRLVDHAALSEGMAMALQAIMATDSPAFSSGRAQMAATLDGLLTTGADSGSLREDVTGRMLLRGLSGVCSLKDDPGWYEDGRRVAELLASGLLLR
jgi:AcrR family transcriptional regulator